MSKFSKYPSLVLFALFIMGGFIIDALNPPKNFSELENRYLQQPPVYSWSTLVDNTYTQKYETFINDQFIGRDSWITIKSMSEAALGKIENNGVVYGSGGQMFEKNYSLDNKRKDDNVSYVLKYKNQNPDERIHLMIVPSAYEILKDKVPEGLGNIDQLTLIEEIYSKMNTAGISTIDVAKNLSAHKDEYIYYRTDHHWTTLGAYYGYEAVCKDLGVTPADFSGYKANAIDGFYGTHFSKAKLFNAVPDKITWYDIDVNNITIDSEKVESLYDLSILDKRGKYEMFLHGNNGIMIIETKPNDTKKDNILIIKDSYANSFIPYLTANYNTITVVDLRSTKQNLSEIMAKNTFDDILVLYSSNNFTTDVNIAKISY